MGVNIKQKDYMLLSPALFKKNERLWIKSQSDVARESTSMVNL